MDNPFEIIDQRLSNIERLLLDIKHGQLNKKAKRKCKKQTAMNFTITEMQSKTGDMFYVGQFQWSRPKNFIDIGLKHKERHRYYAELSPDEAIEFANEIIRIAKIAKDKANDI